jgi:hypothetical protein
MKLLEILALVIMAIGFIIVYAAKPVVRKYDLAKNQKCEHSQQMTEEEIEEYKFNKAVLRVKMLGLIVSIPGIIILIFFFK